MQPHIRSNPRPNIIRANLSLEAHGKTLAASDTPTTPDFLTALATAAFVVAECQEHVLPEHVGYGDFDDLAKRVALAQAYVGFVARSGA